MASAGDDLYQYDGQHVGHRVVTSTFQFQHRAEMLLQVHPLRTEQVEHRRRVGRRHGGGQQQGCEQGQLDVGLVPVGNIKDEHTSQQGGEQDAGSRQNNSRSEYRLDVAVFRVHTSGKRMMLNAIIPINCASEALLNCNPNPSLPKSIPTTRKSKRVGIPNRYPVLLIRILEKSGLTQSSKYFLP